MFNQARPASRGKGGIGPVQKGGRERRVFPSSLAWAQRLIRSNSSCSSKWRRGSRKEPALQRGEARADFPWPEGARSPRSWRAQSVVLAGFTPSLGEDFTSPPSHSAHSDTYSHGPSSHPRQWEFWQRELLTKGFWDSQDKSQRIYLVTLSFLFPEPHLQTKYLLFFITKIWGHLRSCTLVCKGLLCYQHISFNYRAVNTRLLVTHCRVQVQLYTMTSASKFRCLSSRYSQWSSEAQSGCLNIRIQGCSKEHLRCLHGTCWCDLKPGHPEEAPAFSPGFRNGPGHCSKPPPAFLTGGARGFRETHDVC